MPHEHGALVTLAGATFAGAALASTPLSALAAGAALMASFLARGPVDRVAARTPWRLWDGRALIACATVAALVVGAFALARPSVGLLLAAAVLSLPAASYGARRLRAHRAFAVEAAGMALAGGAAGLAALAGGAELSTALALGVVIGAHAAVSVPLVRAELRSRERARALRAVALGALMLLLAAAFVVALGRPRFAFALAPRGLHVALRALRGRVRSAPSAAALREVVLLLVTAALVVAAA